MNNQVQPAASIILSALIFLACSLPNPGPREAAKPADRDLSETILRLDGAMFEAFNSRDFERFREFFSPDLEVYQDNIGFRDYEQSMEAFRQLFIRDSVLTRRLVEGSLDVYPIKGYGAIATGRHTFCHVENGKTDCGTYKFVHVWEQKQGEWKITRIITYDH